MKIALAQMKMSADIKENYKKTLQLICEASKRGAEMICFPEIQLTPFFPQYPDRDVDEYTMTEDGSYVKGICEACKAYHIFASPNLYMEKDGCRYDMSLLIDDQGEIIGRHKMVHIAKCEKFYEQSYYTPSEEGFSVFETRLGKIGIVVCFDRHYPESIRTEALRGAELIVIPTANTSEEPSELFQWEIRVQAFQNSVNIAMCNRVGIEENMNFSGESLLCDCMGNIIAAAGDTEELLVADVDVPKAAVTRKAKPYTSLRRKELYE
ncbi:MAG: carbon-nitrogen hydrolase family protein [Lachnospiraceae bacterium]|nr:carbon-nitrogen hydrolase family protein [Lachnospiraceae bacterium]